MFGFKRRAQERAAKKEAAFVAVCQVAHAYLVEELHDTVAWLILNHDLADQSDTLLTKVESVREGIDAVLIDRIEAFGSELEDAGQLVGSGAVVANAVRNMLLVTGTFDRGETQGDFCYILGFTRDGSVMREPPTPQEFDGAEYERGYQLGQEAGQKIVDAIDEMMERLVKPWADDMIDVFTKRVAMKVIFCDEKPEREVRFSLAEFNRAVNDHLGQIEPDLRAKLSAHEQLSRDLDTLEAFEFLLKTRLDSLRHNLTVAAIETAECIVSARREEMGLNVEQGELLTNGRKILKEARAMPVSLSEDERKLLRTCLEIHE